MRALTLAVALATAACGSEPTTPPADDGSSGSGSSSDGSGGGTESSGTESSGTESSGTDSSDTDSSTGDGSDSGDDSDDSGDTGGPLRLEQITLAYGDDPDQSLDLYKPQGRPAAPMTLVVLAHGGLWQGGSKVSLAALCQAVVLAGDGALACASIDYRLSDSLGGVCRGAGVDTYGEQARDLVAAVVTLQGQAAVYGLDPARVFIGGHSAGGHLAQLLNLRWSAFAIDCPIPGACPPIRGAIGFEGIYDIPAWNSYDAEVWNGAFACATRKAFGAPVDDPPACVDGPSQLPCWDMGSPTYLAQHAAELGLAPLGDALIIHAPDDDWVDIAEVGKLAAALSAAAPEITVIQASDGSCGSGGHDAILTDPALTGCIVDFVLTP